MIQAAITPSGQLGFTSSVSGIAIYLDNWAIKAFAKGNRDLRERFITTVCNGADVLFSTYHAVEALGPQGASSEAFKEFLNQLGAHWYPVTADIFKVLKLEGQGMSGSQCSYDDELLRAYFSSNTAENVPGSNKLIDLSSDSFFRLGRFIDWLAPQRGQFLAKCSEFDRTMKDYVAKLRSKFKTDPAWLDRALPAFQFTPSSAARFAFVHLLRQLIMDSGFQIKPGDAMDLGHAVIATAFANFATLDKQWKSRVENLPKPNISPRVYYEPQLESMVSDIEDALVQLKRMGRSAPVFEQRNA